MYFIPLTQVESVELVIHALRVAGGQADCSSCPVRKVCMKQCLTLAEGIQRMVVSNNLPTMDFLAGRGDEDPPSGPVAGGGSHLRIVK